MKRFKKVAPILVFAFLFLGLLIRLYKLKAQPFSDWDEGIYAQVAKEILKNKTLDTTFNGHVWLNKPPLSHLLIAIVFGIFGYSHVAARSIFTIFSFATLILLYKLTQKILKELLKIEDSHLPLISVLTLAATPLFLERATSLNTDIVIATTYLGYFYFAENFKIKTLFLLIGVWSKSLVGFYPLFIEPFLWLRQKLNLKKLLKNILALSSQIFLASLWYIWAYTKYGNYFVKAHFLDQIFKRVTAPIELHFGNKWYYFKLLWENLNFISLIIAAGYFVISIHFLKFFIKKRFKALKSEKLLWYVILLSPLPFFALLIIGKSKIYWYLLFILPIMAISIPYVLSLVNSKTRLLISVPLIAFLLFQFTKQTYLLIPKYEIDVKLKLAQCSKKLPYKNLAFLIEKKEREIRKVVESSNLQTETTFIYGGSPSFVFYSDKKIKFFYDPQEFVKNYSKYNILVFQKQDELNLGFDLSAYNEACKINDWRVMFSEHAEN